MMAGSSEGAAGSCGDRSKDARTASARRQAPQLEALRGALTPPRLAGCGSPGRWVSPGRAGFGGSPWLNGTAPRAGASPHRTRPPVAQQEQHQEERRLRQQHARSLGGGSRGPGHADGEDAVPVFSLAAWDYVR